MTERRNAIDELKYDFDMWFAKVRELFPEAITVQEEESLIQIVRSGRCIQEVMISILEQYEDGS